MKQCQKCLKGGHWTYQCKEERVYVSKPSRTTELRQMKKKSEKPKREEEPVLAIEDRDGFADELLKEIRRERKVQEQKRRRSASP